MPLKLKPKKQEKLEVLQLMLEEQQQEQLLPRKVKEERN